MSTRKLPSCVGKRIYPIYSVMPKGVEHDPLAELEARYAAPIYSVMPKGVEHMTRWSIGAPLGRPIYSVMPKGVEHHVDGSTTTLTATDILRDAERR